MSIGAARLKIAEANRLYLEAAHSHLEGDVERATRLRELAKKELVRAAIGSLPPAAISLAAPQAVLLGRAAAKAKVEELDAEAWAQAIAEACG